MKIKEIIINHNKQLADKIANPELSSEIMGMYDKTCQDTNGLTMLVYEVYNPSAIYDTIDDLYMLHETVSKIKYDTQLVEIVELLIRYYENN